MKCDIEDFEGVFTITTKPAFRDRIFFYVTMLLLAAIIFLNARGFFDRWVGTSRFLWFTFPMTAGTALIIFLLILLAIGFVHNGLRTVIKVDKANKKLEVTKKWFDYPRDTWNVPFNEITGLSIQYDLPPLANFDERSDHRILDDGKIILESSGKRAIIMKPYYSLKIQIRSEMRTIIKTAYYGRTMLVEVLNLLRENLR